MDPVSEPTIPKSLDKAMEQKNGHTAPAGISIRNGPVTDDAMDVDDEPITKGKRKSRGSVTKAVNYNEVPSASEDEKPTVRQLGDTTPRLHTDMSHRPRDKEHQRLRRR